MLSILRKHVATVEHSNFLLTEMKTSITVTSLYIYAEMYFNMMIIFIKEKHHCHKN